MSKTNLRKAPRPSLWSADIRTLTYYRKNKAIQGRVKFVRAAATRALMKAPLRRKILIDRIAEAFEELGQFKPHDLRLSIFEILEYLHLTNQLTKSLDDSGQAYFSRV